MANLNKYRIIFVGRNCYAHLASILFVNCSRTAKTILASALPHCHKPLRVNSISTVLKQLSDLFVYTVWFPVIVHLDDVSIDYEEGGVFLFFLMVERK